ncbi:hypothetical protein [Orrella marina]|uniref:hypothetical protein n=1 Tax=Orrella marina TaxID=2163011 RepID=UPI00131EFDC9|nr:hypothetical protein [Orrella marina]
MILVGGFLRKAPWSVERYPDECRLVVAPDHLKAKRSPEEVPRFVYLLALSGEFGEIALMRMIKAIGCSSPARLCSGFLHGSLP